MPKLKLTGKQTEGWKPLPDGTVDIMIDDISETVSKKDIPQLKLSCHVEGGRHDAKKTTLWYSLAPNALWKVMILCDACGVEYDADELDELDPETGKPLISLELDTDDLIGQIYTVDVSQQTNPNTGHLNNNFNNERPVEGSAAEKRLQEMQAEAEAEDTDSDNGAEAAEAAEAPEADPKEPEAAAAAAAAPASGRRRRARGR